MKKQILMLSLVLLLVVSALGLYVSAKQQKGYTVLSGKTREYIVSHMTQTESLEFQLL